MISAVIHDPKGGTALLAPTVDASPLLHVISRVGGADPLPDEQAHGVVGWLLQVLVIGVGAGCGL